MSAAPAGKDVQKFWELCSISRTIGGRRATDVPERYGSGSQRAATVASGTGASSSTTPMEVSGDAELAARLEAEEFAEAAEEPTTGGVSSSASGSAPPPPAVAAVAAASPFKQPHPHHQDLGMEPAARTTPPVIRFLEPEQEAEPPKGPALNVPSTAKAKSGM